MKVNAQQNDSLDDIIYRVFGTTYGGILEQTLLLNPHLTANTILTLDTEVILPDQVNAGSRKTDVIQLWD